MPGPVFAGRPEGRIDRLVDINRELKARGASIEHFYDY